MSRNTIFGRFCVLVILVLVNEIIASILRHLLIRVTEHNVGLFRVLVRYLFIFLAELIDSVLRDPPRSGA